MQKFNIQSKLEAYTGFITEPKTKYFDNGSLVVELSIPLKFQKDDEPVWLSCEAWNKLGEVAMCLEKGTKVFVQGVIKENEHNGKVYKKLQVYTLTAI